MPSDLRNTWFSFGHGPSRWPQFGPFTQKAGHHDLVAVADGHVNGPDAVLVHGFNIQASLQKHFRKFDVIFHHGSMM